MLIFIHWDLMMRFSLTMVLTCGNIYEVSTLMLFASLTILFICILNTKIHPICEYLFHIHPHLSFILIKHHPNPQNLLGLSKIPSYHILYVPCLVSTIFLIIALSIFLYHRNGNHSNGFKTKNNYILHL